jgi:hypothetical protein
MVLEGTDFSNHIMTIEVPRVKESERLLAPASNSIKPEGFKPKRIEPTSLGLYDGHSVFYCYGLYGYYLKYKNENYSIPNWGQQENLYELFNLSHAINIIDWKIKNKKNTIKNHI